MKYVTTKDIAWLAGLLEGEGCFNTIVWMQTLYVFLGNRRRAKIREIIKEWASAPNKPYTNSYTRYMRVGSAA